MTSTCCICGKTFTARHSYGLCPMCLSHDRIREYDRVESVASKARKQGIVPVTLTLVEWLSVMSDHAGLCSFCCIYSASVIEMHDRTKGLTYDNVIPACKACVAMRRGGLEEAEKRIGVYLGREDRLPTFVPQNEEEAKPHVEYQQ